MGFSIAATTASFMYILHASYILLQMHYACTSFYNSLPTIKGEVAANNNVLQGE